MSAYVVLIRDRMTDAAELEIYSQKAALARVGHDITPLAFYGALQVLEGAPADGVVIIRFPTKGDALRWYQSPAYQAARVHRLNGAECRVFIVEGIANEASASLST